MRQKFGDQFKQRFWPVFQVRIKYTLPWPNGPNPHAVTRLLFQAFNCLLPVLAPEPDGEGALASFLPSSS